MIILTEYKVNFCDQQREKEQYDWRREKQIGFHIIRILKWNHFTPIRRDETLDFSSWSETFRSLNVVKGTKKLAIE